MSSSAETETSQTSDENSTPKFEDAVKRKRKRTTAFWKKKVARQRKDFKGRIKILEEKIRDLKKERLELGKKLCKEEKEKEILKVLFDAECTRTRELKKDMENVWNFIKRRGNLNFNGPGRFVIDKEVGEKNDGNGEKEATHQSRKPKYYCKDCGMSFTNESRLQTHVEKYQALGKSCAENETPQQQDTENGEDDNSEGRPRRPKPCEKYICVTCGLSLSRSSNLRRHMALHDGSRHFCCPVCQKDVTRKDNLLKHIRRMHLSNKD